MAMKTFHGHDIIQCCIIEGKIISLKYIINKFKFNNTIYLNYLKYISLTAVNDIKIILKYYYNTYLITKIKLNYENIFFIIYNKRN